MEKTTITFYLPKDLFLEMKVAAVKRGISISDLVTSCTLAMIEDDTFDPQKRKPEFNKNTMVYLPLNEKRIIKTAAARYSATLSELICQALAKYANSNRQLPLRNNTGNQKLPRQKKSLAPQNKHNLSYNLTEENNSKLKRISATTGMTRKQILMDLLQNMGKTPLVSGKTSPKSERSSMLLTPEELEYLNSKASELNLSINDMINRSLEQY